MATTRELVERTWELTFEDLGEEDRSAISLLFLDFIGVAARGSATPSAIAVQRFIEASPHSGTSPIIGTFATADPLKAAMANAVGGHSIEYDDVHNASSSHPGVVVFPTALAVAELTQSDAQAFFLGVARGYEVMCRVGRAVDPRSHYARHFHPTATIGHFGAAAAAASLLGLDLDQIVSALGIAATMAAGSMQFLLDGAWTKRWHPAQASRNGIEAAQLALHGYVGPEDGISGERGFLNGYSESPRPHELVADWGSRDLEVRNTSVKAHTCCRYMQGPIDALLAMRLEHKLQAADVKGVAIGIPSVAGDIIWNPISLKRRPSTIVDAQFSMPYGAAVALVKGSASLGEFDGSLFADAEVRRLMDVTECVPDTQLDSVYPAQWSAWAEVKTWSGKTLRTEVSDPKGDPANPLTHHELVDKFINITDGIFSPSRQAEIVDIASGRVEQFDLSDLLPALGRDVLDRDGQERWGVNS